MILHQCPKCHKPNVQERTSKRTGRPYLANVATYDNGASYFRSLHTYEECAASLAEFNARVDEATAKREEEAVRYDAHQAWAEEGKRLQESGASIDVIMAHFDKMP